jgi:hypothetical protein
MQAKPTFGKRGVVSPKAAAFSGTGRVTTRPAAASNPALDIAAVGEADMQLAIGPRWEKYRPLWQNLNAGLPAASFAWAGFFFGGMWLLYRKQYAAFFATFLAHLAIAYVTPGNAKWLNLVIAGVIAVGGKWWITRSAALMVVRTRSLGLPETETKSRIGQQGGVSWFGPITVLVFAIGLGVAFGISRAMLHHHH